MWGEHSIRNILLLCLWTQNTKVSLHRSLNGAVGFVSESLLWSQQLCWSFKYHRRFTWSLHFPPSSTQVTYNMWWWKMSCIEWSAFSYYKGVFTYFQSLFWLWSPWSVAVLPPALLSRKCFCGPEMLRVLSAGLTPHTAHPPVGSVCTGPDRGWAAQLEQANPGGIGGVCIEAPLYMGQPSLSGSPVPLWWGNLPGWWCGHAEALKVQVQGSAEAALTAQVALVARQVTWLAALSAEAAVQQALGVG